MKLSNFNKLMGMALLGLTVMLAGGGIAKAQDNDRDRNNNMQNGQEHYRIRRGRKTYETDSHGADLLRQAVNQGYSQGFQAGQSDRSSRHRNNWKNNSIYRSGDMGYESSVDRSQYQYYFQQGFQKGYDDGYNSRTRYGSNNTILGDVLNTIFRPERY